MEENIHQVTWWFFFVIFRKHKLDISQIPLLTLSPSNSSFAQSFVFRFQPIIYHFEGILMQNVKIKIIILEKLLITDSFAITTRFLITKRQSFILVHRDLFKLVL